MTKICTLCGEEKPISEFTKDKLGRDGLKSSCRDCLSFQRKLRRRKDPSLDHKSCKRWRTKNAVQIKTISLAYRRNWTPEQRAAKNIKRIQWAHDNPERTKYLGRRGALKKYGITPEDFERMRAERKGACDICKKVPKLLNIDHEHRTGKIRGLLCKQCNTAIGCLNDSVETLSAAILYLAIPSCP